MAPTSDQYKITEAIRAALAAALTQVQFHNTKTNQTPTIPYALLYPLGWANLDGSLDDGQEDGDFMLQVSSVGSTAQQCGAVQARIKKTLTQKTGSEYTLQITATGIDAEQWRRVMELGPIEDSGENTFRANDTYLFRRSM